VQIIVMQGGIFLLEQLSWLVVKASPKAPRASVDNAGTRADKLSSLEGCTFLTFASEAPCTPEGQGEQYYFHIHLT
jgi:hypothetical protein